MGSRRITDAHQEGERVEPRARHKAKFPRVRATDPRRTAGVSIWVFTIGLLAHVAVKTWRALRLAIVAMEDWLVLTKKAQYGLAITRILLGLAAFGILLTHWSTRLYTFGAGAAWSGEMEGQANSEFPRIWLFSIFHRTVADNTLFSVLYILLFLLTIPVILGWRFRIIGPVFWVGWVSFSEVNDYSGDQSANLIRIAFLLLLFADPAKRWSLDARRRARNGEIFEEGSSLNLIGTALHNLAVIGVGAQVILVYLAGAFYKIQGESWRNGVAVYETLSVERYNTWPALSSLIVQWGPMVALATVGTLALQALFGAMLLHRFTRIIALIGMLMFHLGIGILMGLPWFSLIMFAVDAIFIRDRSWQAVSDGVARRWRRARSL